MIVEPTSAPELGIMREARVEPERWEELDACPICGSAEHLLDLSLVEGRFPGAGLAACTDCEHVFKRRRPQTSWFQDYYADDWDAHGQAETPAARPRAKILDFCGPHLGERARVLDMGAGYGADILAFKQAGHEAHALESSRHRAEHIERELGIPCIRSDFEQADLPGQFDLIFSHHVLEHIADPKLVVARAHEVLADGGLFYTAVPNCLNFEHPLQLVHYAPHQSGFSPKSFARLLNDHGFEIVAAKATRELGVLARKTSAPVAPDANGDGAAERAAFAEATRRWMAEGYGDHEGERTLLWWRGAGKGRCYRGASLPGGRLTWPSVQAACKAHRNLPDRWRRRSRRFVPPYVYGKYLRMLQATVTGGPELPVRITYADGAAPPVWVK